MKDTVKIESENTKIIAHRGLSSIECENTNAAFVAAGNRSYFGIETDVHITKDGDFAIIHDDNAKRVCGEDVSVEESTFESLRTLCLNDQNCTEATKRTDLTVPHLREYIGICKKYGKTGVLELKNPMERKYIEKIVDFIKNEDYLENMIFISFSWDNLIILKSIVPDLRLQFLTGKITDELIDRLAENKIDLDVRYDALDRENIEKLHKRGILVNCWTCDDPDAAKKLISYGVDYITTNALE